MTNITELRNREFQARVRLADTKALHADPRGYRAALDQAEKEARDARAALDQARPCRFCDRVAVAQKWAGSYGTAWVCENHIGTANALADDALAAEREGGRALAQMLKDERAMMR